MSSSPLQRARIRNIHAQVQNALDRAHSQAQATGTEGIELSQSLFDLDVAIGEYSGVDEVTLLGDSVGNAHVFFLLNSGLPEALEELHRQILIDRSTTNYHELTIARLEHKRYCEVFRLFTFSTKTASELIVHLQQSSLQQHSHERRQHPSYSWYRSNEARASLRQLVKGISIWPPLPNMMQPFTPLKSEYLLPSTYGIWTAGITILHKLESFWKEADYLALSESDRAMCDLRHALFWASICKTALHNLEHDHSVFLDTESTQALPQIVGSVKFVLSAIKSIWLLDQLELNSSFGWLPRKIRDLSVMLLHKHAEYFEHFFNLGLCSPTLVDISRFGDFSFKIPVHIVEENARKMRTVKEELDMGDRNYIGQRTDLHLLTQPQPTSPTMHAACINPEDMFRLTNDMEGLQVAALETVSSLPEPVLLPVSSHPNSLSTQENEVEMVNLERHLAGGSIQGFLNGVYSLDTMPPYNQGYIKSHIRVLKSFSGSDSYVRVCTKRDGAPFHEVKELVPSYMFLDNNEHENPLFLRSAGIPLGLNYKIRSINDMSEPNFEELYGLKGALIGARFEVQYPALSILLHRKGQSEAERLRPAKLQIWTNSKELDSNTTSSGPATQASNEVLVSPRHRKIPLESTEDDLESTKIYIYSQHCIYVFFVSDRIVANKQINPQKLLSRSLPSTLFLTPNKSKGITSIRIRVIEGTPRSPAGIPLDQMKLHHSDQDTAAFTEYHSLQIEFPSSQILDECFDDLHYFLTQWKERRKQAEDFKKHERNVRLHWKSKFTKGPRPSSTIM